jgi:hypothetical protein
MGIEEGWNQIVTYDPADVIRFLMGFPEAHVAEWGLPGPASNTDPEMIGP